MEIETTQHPKPQRAKREAPWYFLRDSSGKPNGMFGIAYVAGWVAILLMLVCGLFGGMQLTLGGWLTGQVPRFDPAVMSMLLPLLAAFVPGYIMRKRDDAKGPRNG